MLNLLAGALTLSLAANAPSASPLAIQPSLPTAPQTIVPIASRPEADDAWQNEVVYQIYPATFADSDGDGIGDLRGILGKVDYLQSLGVNVIWLNPIFLNSHHDGGYDVIDYLDIDPMFGNLDDFFALRDALHARKMKIMLDLVLNHTSDEHPWYAQEKHLKRLQRRLTDIIDKSTRLDGERIVGLLGDPASRSDAVGPLPRSVASAQKLIDDFLTIDDAAAEAAGYPEKNAQLTTLARVLAPCANSDKKCLGTTQPFDDFYIWRDKPNNWTGIFSGSAWHAVEGTGAYSMSLFSKHQIDLNWRNPRVRAAIAHVIATWEARGIDGLRMDSFATLSKNPTFPSAAPADAKPICGGQKEYTNLPAVHRYLRELARIFSPNLRSIGEAAFTKTAGALSYCAKDNIKENDEVKELFVFDHLAFDAVDSKFHPAPLDVAKFKNELANQQRLIHDRAWLGNYLENHDQLRIPNRFGDANTYRVQSAKLFASLLLTLEGTPYIYQGQEIAMTNLPASFFKGIADVDDIEARQYYEDQVKKPHPRAHLLADVIARSRDHMRSAMQWSGDANAGFSAKPGIVRVNPATATINVEAARADPDSVWYFYRRLIAERRTHPSWVHGVFTDLLPKHPKVFAYVRHHPHEQSLVLLNLSGELQKVAVPAGALPGLPLTDAIGNYVGDAPVAQQQVVLRPWEAHILVGKPASVGLPEVPVAAPPPGPALRPAYD